MSGQPRDWIGSTIGAILAGTHGESRPLNDELSLAEHTWVTRTGAAPPPREGETGRAVAGRYVLVDLLGAGGGGEVFLAQDLRTEDLVAIKLVPIGTPDQETRARRELGALRWLDLPGVVRLLDDGTVGNQRFIVMERVRGHPFPGLPMPDTWADLAPRVQALLEVVRQVHQAGLLHRDLKPGNVLMRDPHTPCMLDFGISRGKALAPGGRATELTPGFAAPEQYQGQVGDPRTDLFAIGRMILRTGVPLPEAVAQVLDYITAPEPGDRPSSATEALAQLQAASPACFPPKPALALPAQVASERDLHPLFAGPDRFLHLVEDGARLLWNEAQQDPTRIEAVARDWISRGDATLDAGRLHLTRRRLERMLLRLGWTYDGRRTPPIDLQASAETLMSAMDEAMGQGRDHQALALATVALQLGEQDTDQGPAQRRLCEGLVLAALGLESRGAIEDALQLLARIPSRSAWVEQLTQLCLAWRDTLDEQPERAADALDQVGELDHPELAAWAMATRVGIARARGLEAERAVLSELQQWGDARPEWAGRHKSWLGNLAYREGRYSDAARLHRESGALRAHGRSQIAALLNAAMALLESRELESAQTLALEVQAQSAAIRHPLYEAYGWWVARSAGYRAGKEQGPTPGAIEGATAIGPHLEGNVCMVEASIAWRAGQLERTRTHARRGEQAFRRAGFPPGAQLLRALAWAAGDTQAFPPEHLHADPPRLAAQSIALWHNTGTDPAQILCVHEALPPGWAPPPTQRLEVLSGPEIIRGVPRPPLVSQEGPTQ